MGGVAAGGRLNAPFQRELRTDDCLEPAFEEKERQDSTNLQCGGNVALIIAHSGPRAACLGLCPV
jgi:hypothetical protein